MNSLVTNSAAMSGRGDVRARAVARSARRTANAEPRRPAPSRLRLQALHGFHGFHGARVRRSTGTLALIAALTGTLAMIAYRIGTVADGATMETQPAAVATATTTSVLGS
jgi:hypothetical protein